MAISSDTTLMLDAEPLGSGVCQTDLSTYRYHLRHCHADVEALGSRPEWGLAVSGMACALLIGILLGRAIARLR